MAVGALPVPLGLYGRGRVIAGAQFPGALDPGWWQGGSWLPDSLADPDMAGSCRGARAWCATSYHSAPAPPLMPGCC